MPPARFFYESDLRGGLDTRGPDGASPYSMVIARDVVRDTDGAYKKRGGMQQTSATTFTNGIVAAFYWPITGAHVALSNGKIFTAPGHTLPLAWTDRGGTFAVGGVSHMIQFRDGTAEVLYVVDGVNALRSVTQAFAVSGNIASTPTLLSHLAVYNNRLFALDVAAKKLHWSGLNNGHTLSQSASGGGTVVLDMNPGESPREIIATGDALFIVNDRSVSRFTGWSQDDFSVESGLRGAYIQLPTLNGASAIAVQNVLYVTTQQGEVYQLALGNAPKLISEPVRGLPITTSTQTHQNTIALPGLRLIVWPCNTTLDGGTSRFICYNYERGVWECSWQGVGLASQVLWADTSIALTSDRNLLYFLANDNTVYRFDRDRFDDGANAAGANGSGFGGTILTQDVIVEGHYGALAPTFGYLIGEITNATGMNFFRSVGGAQSQTAIAGAGSGRFRFPVGGGPSTSLQVGFTDSSTHGQLARISSVAVEGYVYRKRMAPTAVLTP